MSHEDLKARNSGGLEYGHLINNQVVGKVNQEKQEYIKMAKTKQLALKNEKSKFYKGGLRLELAYDHLDGRTRVAKSIKAIRDDLRKYVGETSAVSEILISRISYKALKLSLYELSSLQNLENQEAHYYLPMANSLRLDLQALEVLTGRPQPPDLESYINAKYRDKK